MKLHLIKDFPEKCMLKLEHRTLNSLFNNAISVLGSKRNLAFILDTSWDTLYHYERGVKFIPFKIIQSLLHICKLEYKYLQKNIREIRFRYTTSFEVLDQKLIVDFRTKEGIKLIAALAGDGYLNTCGNVGYVNKNETLRNDFLENLYKTFSCVKLPNYNNAYRGKDLSLSRFFGYVFEKAGYPKCRKVFANPRIPEWILNCSNNTLVSSYLQQLFDDEGHVSVEKRMIDLPQSIDISKEDKAPELLKGIKFLLEKIGVRTNNLYPVLYYKIEENGKIYKRAKYVLTISSYRDVKKFGDKVGFLSKDKQMRIDKIIATPVLIQRKNREIERDALEECKKIQFNNEIITSLLLANKLKLGNAYCQKILKKLAEDNKIVKVANKKPVYAENKRFLMMNGAEFKLSSRI